uniref:COMM domain-containing protein n=1 Tax=Xiphophorus couchianus TaxID=32473 RepID=A0A3B5MD99_9TELE
MMQDFLGGRIPPEIESMSKNLKDVDQELFRKLLKVVVSALEGKDCREVMKSIAESSVIPQERLSHIIAGMHRVLSEAIRIPASLLKQEANGYKFIYDMIKDSVVILDVKLLVKLSRFQQVFTNCWWLV